MVAWMREMVVLGCILEMTPITDGLDLGYERKNIVMTSAVEMA